MNEGEDDGYKTMVEFILPITAQLLEDEKLEVRQAACNTLMDLAAFVKHDELGQHVLTVVLRLAHEDEKEDKTDKEEAENQTHTVDNSNSENKQ